MSALTAATAQALGWRAIEKPGWFAISCTDPGCSHPLHHRTLLGVNRVRHDRKLLDPVQDGHGRLQDRYASWRAARKEKRCRV